MLIHVQDVMKERLQQVGDSRFVIHYFQPQSLVSSRNFHETLAFFLGSMVRHSALRAVNVLTITDSLPHKRSVIVLRSGWLCFCATLFSRLKYVQVGAVQRRHAVRIQASVKESGETEAEYRRYVCALRR